ncbi:MAG: GtrA family protein [Actinobacteria bacterium]|nr:GtrA family protein [Actinomycetota bacterium]
MLAIIGAHYYLVIQWFVWVISIPPNTLLMRHFAFRAQGDWRHQVARSYLVYLPAQLLNAGLLVLMVRGFGLTPILGQLSAAVIVTVMTYLGHKYFTFRKTIR